MSSTILTIYSTRISQTERRFSFLKLKIGSFVEGIKEVPNFSLKKIERKVKKVKKIASLIYL